MKCKNCENIFEGKYCNQCGQKVMEQRFTVKQIFTTLISIITNLESGFLKTAKSLFKAPAQLINDYINGKTRPYYHPLRYLIILTTITTVINLSFGIFDASQSDMQQLFNPGADDHDLARQARIQEQVKQYLNFIPLLVIPFISLVSYRLFKERHLNYAEHLIANSFMSGQLNFISLPFLLIYALFPSLTKFLLPVTALINSIYYAYVYSDLFKISFWRGIWYGFLAYALGLLFMIITALTIVITGVSIYLLLFK